MALTDLHSTATRPREELWPSGGRIRQRRRVRASPCQCWSECAPRSKRGMQAAPSEGTMRSGGNGVRGDWREWVRLRGWSSGSVGLVPHRCEPARSPRCCYCPSGIQGGGGRGRRRRREGSEVSVWRRSSWKGSSDRISCTHDSRPPLPWHCQPKSVTVQKRFADYFWEIIRKQKLKTR